MDIRVICLLHCVRR